MVFYLLKQKNQLIEVVLNERKRKLIREAEYCSSGLVQSTRVSKNLIPLLHSHIELCIRYLREEGKLKVQIKNAMKTDIIIKQMVCVLKIFSYMPNK
jgi:hypothetical protein